MCDLKSVTICLNKQRISRGHHSRCTVRFLPGVTIDITQKSKYTYSIQMFIFSKPLSMLYIIVNVEDELDKYL